MSLKDLTKEKHQAAESTAFMKSVFAKTMPLDTWADFTFQKLLWYGTIEMKCRAAGYLTDLPDIERAHKIYKDYRAMTGGDHKHKWRQESSDYHRYLLTLDNSKILAHLYTWHMGDLFGGQMIKKIIDAPHEHLEFKDPQLLMTNIRAKLSDDLAEEANIAFDWAIKIMESYDSSI